MAYGVPTTAFTSRIPNKLMPTLQKLAADQGVPTATLGTQILTAYISSQTAKNP